MCDCGLHRRRFLLGAAGLAGTTLLAGCGAPGDGMSFLSADEERQMGQQGWAEVTAQETVSTDKKKAAAVKRVAARIVTASGGNPAEWEFVLFRNPEVNAFALPSNKVGVYEGLFTVASTDGQLAAILGHEVSHVYLQHSARRANRTIATGLGLQILSAGLQMGGVESAGAINDLATQGAQYGFLLPFSREQESEADAKGVMIMARAGYDPNEAVAFWRASAAASKGNRPPAFASTHPTDEARIEALQALMPEAMEVYRSSQKA